MSKYTTELRFICEEKAGLNESVGYTNVKSTIEAARPNIFDFDYPFFTDDESVIIAHPELADYKKNLEIKILKHYYTREIAAETYGLWHLWLDTKINEIMPYYNKLYLSELLEFNPLKDTNYTTEHSRETLGDSNTVDLTANDSTSSTNDSRVTANSTTNQSKSNSTTNVDDTAWNYENDTPQGSISGLEDLTYLSRATKSTDDNDTTVNSSSESADDSILRDDGKSNSATNQITNRDSKNTFTDNENYSEIVDGKRGSESYSDLLNKFRDTFLNIDLMIIEELDDLFLKLW